ncbi:MAG: hypothetical protein ABUK08_00400 [Candidatus Humimicrobiaceae bacterium]
MEIKEIRKNLKAKLGYNARMVSISKRGCTINFTIRDNKVNYSELNDFSKTFDDISYDAATQCILRGGNIFTTIKFSDDVRESLTWGYLAAVEKAISNLTGQYLEDIEGTDFMIDKSLNGFNLWVKEAGCGSRVTECYDAKDIAFSIAIKS